MDDDSDYSGDDFDVEDGIKLVQVPMLKVDVIEYEERAKEDSL